MADPEDLVAHREGWIATDNDGLLVFGAAVLVQSWKRDPGDPAGALLSDALAFLVGP